VIVAHEASVMDLFSVDLDRLAGVVVEHGGPQSHAAILARSLGIPMVGQVPDFVGQVFPGRHLLVDGTAGRVCLDYSGEADARKSLPAQGASLLSSDVPASEVIPEGLPRVEANVNLLCEVAQAVEQRADGVGLYRTE